MMTSGASGLLRACLESLGGRAIGLWRLDRDHLALVAFEGSANLDPDVVARFERATDRVPLDRDELGIVRAVALNQVLVSAAVELPEDVGSGYWLRAFGATRSVAVPLCDGVGACRGVFSIALNGDDPPAEEVAAVLRASGADRFLEGGPVEPPGRSIGATVPLDAKADRPENGQSSVDVPPA